ncbi:MAG: acyltransferase, partial [Hymenobacter sp.]
PTLTKASLATKAVAVKSFNKIRAISSRQSATQTGATLRQLGSQSQLPTNCFLQNPQHIVIGRRFQAQEGLHLSAVTEQAGEQFQPAITIGDNVSLGANCHISCVSEVTIGNWVLIADGVYIADNWRDESPAARHLPPGRRQLLSKGAVVLHDNVLIEAGARILSGVTIGRNAIVRAHAVVQENVAPYAIVAGCPARVVGPAPEE